MLDLTRLFGRDKSAFVVKAGEFVFHEGDASSEMYVVLDGQIDIVIGDKIVETVDPGGMFGEMSLIGPAPRSAAAVARFDATLVPVDARRFQFLIQQTPYFAIHVISVLADRLRRMPPPPDAPVYGED
ncbi:MAG: Crp/Fnr family transcriptional regulator, partial [Candidatus Promineifilaceae bacterium]